jgi:putative nucleotidyltransferase with HDIG domain
MKPQLYIPTISALGLLVIGHCIGDLIQEPVDGQWLALAVLALFTGSLTIRIPSVAARLSVSETFVFASVLLFGTCAGTITIALEILVAVSGIWRKKTTDPQRVVFNVSSGALSIWAAGTAFYMVAGIPPLSVQHADLGTIAVPLAVLASTHFILNSGLIAIAVSLQRRESALSIWRTNFAGLSINYFAGASLAALFVSYTKTIDFLALGVIVPLLAVSYLTFRSSLARVEDATRHVEEVKTLYLSTIETLATAIDAKDQVTHGHIRRVQQLALALARELGVRDLDQLQALEAAALLHDTGKLAIPEHILNKPSKLTRGEFEKMKEHASVGAEILASINFPYPVVPIVRHHHENWDGTGYPDGLRGTNIPVGARILAVVDCYDALTSDRPYRPRMSDREAVAILVQRRAFMYDPLIVDTFVQNLNSLTAQIATQPEVAVVASQRLLFAQPTTLPISQATSEQMDSLLDSAIRQTGATIAAIFAADRDRDCLVALSLRGRGGPIEHAIRIPIGYGMSGWVVANGIPIFNAEASLDFRGHPPVPGLVRSICVPIFIRDQVAGVISMYTDDPRGFNDDDRILLEELTTRLQTGDSASSFDVMLRATQSTLESRRTIH